MAPLRVGSGQLASRVPVGLGCGMAWKVQYWALHVGVDQRRRHRRRQTPVSSTLRISCLADVWVSEDRYSKAGARRLRRRRYLRASMDLGDVQVSEGLSLTWRMDVMSCRCK